MLGFAGSSMITNLPANAGHVCSAPELGRSPRGGNGNPLQHSYLKNPMDSGTWQSMGFQRVSHTTEHACTHVYLC